MLSAENFTIDHIRKLRDKYHKDVALIERTVYAFGLLEALVKSGLKFIFKGGTSLLLLLDSPMRLSTDIDIIVSPDTQIEEYIEKVKTIFPFISAEESIRTQKATIRKRHFKFNYTSPVNNDQPLYILLDVLYGENFYRKTIGKEIKNDLVITEGENLTVILPTVDCILGDKLTAFAPRTTGVAFGDKNMEIMKQFYDISNLIHASSDFDDVRDTYWRISNAEIAYRRAKITPEDALNDSIASAICIGSRGKYRPDDFDNFKDGTRKVVTHVFSSGFSMESASRLAPEIIYMLACLLTGAPFAVVDARQHNQENLTQTDLLAMRSFRKIDPLAYGYLVKADKLLRDFRD